MSQRQSCIFYCKEHLEQSNLSQYYNEADFNHVYRKLDGAHCNAYLIGLHAADEIIFNSKKNLDESRNEG